MFGIEAYANENLVYLFFGVFVLMAIFIWYHHWKIARAARFAHIKSFEKIADSISRPRKIVKKTLICLVYLLLVFSLMRPLGNPDQELERESGKSGDKTIVTSLSLEDISQDEGAKDGQKVVVRENARDIIFLLDVSASMGAEDLYPDRLSKAKLMIKDIIDGLDGEHVGLVVFTSVPSVKCVLTLDYTYFKKVLDSIKINDNDFAGTKFIPALTEIINRQFDFSENKFKELMVITDGGDTDLEGLQGDDRKRFLEDLHALVKKAHDEKGIRIHTIGLGTRSGSLVQGVKDDQGNPVRSSLQEEFLAQISREARGIYVAVADSNVDMRQVYEKNIRTDEAGEIEKEIALNPDKLKELVQKEKEQEEVKVVYEELYIYPLFAAILLLIFEFFISETKGAFFKPRVRKTP
jgi:Ca-activated chloride channel homolog